MSVINVGSIPVSPLPVPADIRGSIGQSDKSANTQSETKIRPQLIQSTAADLQRTFNRKLQFEVDQNSNQVIVKVIDKETDKVIKEIPPEELQRLHRNIKEAIGLLFDELV